MQKTGTSHLCLSGNKVHNNIDDFLWHHKNASFILLQKLKKIDHLTEVLDSAVVHSARFYVMMQWLCVSNTFISRLSMVLWFSYFSMYLPKSVFKQEFILTRCSIITNYTIKRIPRLVCFGGQSPLKAPNFQLCLGRASINNPDQTGWISALQCFR